jgi:hypothetical protein
MRRWHPNNASDDAVRITTASRPHSEDISARQRRYLISMGIRTACFILAVVFVGHWEMWVFLVASLILPYVAVVLANVGSNPDPEPADFQPDRRAIEDRPRDRVEGPDA